MLFGRFRILGKLTLLILVPLIGVVALAVPIVINRIDVARDAQDTSDAVQLATQVGSAVQELQEERLLSVGYLFGLIQEPELAVQSAKANDRIRGLKNLDQPLSPGLRKAVDDISKLDSTRANVINRTIRPDLIVTEFTAVVTPIINELALAQKADLNTSAGRQVYALEQALRTDDMISQASGYLTSAVVTKNAGLVGLFYSTLVQLQLLIVNAQPYFTDAQYKLYLGAQDAFASRVGDRFLVEAATDPDSAVKLLQIQTLFPSLRSTIVLGGFVEKRVAQDVDTAVTEDRNAALRTAALVGGGSLLLLLLVIALSLFMARAVARPLRRLTVSADRIARAAEAELERVADDDAEAARPIRLDPVDVAARDEIGDLARAFDRVQTTAVRLVERQVLGRRNVAQMFGHVGRRTQNLVGRQLALIDNLERRETDSDRLRELYRLDHMSSRLRRNASSLVVLSGGAGANDHMAPLALSDVVRLALGEIEDYTRVDVEVPEELVVVPAVVADLTLLLAELMENSTSFSPPHTRVTVTAAELRGGARLAIVDHGLGLSPERLAEENARLTRRERLDLAPTEVLGLFVVGRLARRHGIEVTLTDTAEGGVTAWVDLAPAHLVPQMEPLPAELAPIHATVPSNHTEFAPLIAGGSARHVPGSAQPFDANVLNRATRTLESSRSWNAFAVRPTAPQLEAAPSSAPAAYEVASAAAPVAYEVASAAAPVRYQATTGAAPEASAVTYEATPVAPRAVPATFEATPVAPRAVPATFEATPVAGRFPAAVHELPSAGSAPVDALYQRPQQPVPSAVVPQQRTGPEARNGSAAPLRRRVPGSQLPPETGPKLPTAPPTSDDAIAAREAFDAFEAGVSRPVGRHRAGHGRAAGRGSSPAHPACAGRDPARQRAHEPDPAGHAGAAPRSGGRPGPDGAVRVRRSPGTARNPATTRRTTAMTSPYSTDTGNGRDYAQSQLSAEAKTFNWLLDSFTSGTAGVVEAIAVSSDGLLMAMSAIKDRPNAERLAAVVSGLTSLAGGAASWYALGSLNRVIIDMADGYLLVTSISAGSVLGVIADRTANLGTLAYEMTLFATRAGGALSPRLIAELKNAVQQ